VGSSSRTLHLTTLCLSVRDDELWQAQARVIDHIDDAVVSARPRLRGPVRASLLTVIVLAELPAPVAEFLAFPDLVGLERVAAQHLDKEQVVVRAILVRLQALDVCGPVDVARVVAVDGLLRRGAPLQVKALLFPTVAVPQLDRMYGPGSTYCVIEYARRPPPAPPPPPQDVIRQHAQLAGHVRVGISPPL
jgi:hypothetical protein